MDDDAAGDGVDRISALPDDLLHVILGFLPDATAASRTAVLSRRWRRVWIHALGLSFLETEVTCGSVQTWRYESYDAHVRPFSEERDLSAPCRFASFVAWVLAQRGDAELRSLKIDMRRHCASPERANEWIRYAMQHVAESFCLAIPYIWIPYRTYRPGIQLPSHGSAASIRMSLSGNRFELPMAGAAARYEALTELRLSNASFDEEDEEAFDEEEEEALGSSRSRTRTTLGDFVSSCCPGLRKLEIMSPRGLPELVLRAEALEELPLLTSAEGVRTLDVTAPKLRFLRVQFYARNADRYASYYDDSDDDASKVARVKAPSLQEVAVYTSPQYKRPVLDIHDLTGVRRLVDLHLNIHGQYCRDTDAGLWLLESCPRVEHISVSLEHCDGIVTASELVDLGSDGAAPFAMLTSIDMEACIFPRRHLVTSISSLLLRCPRLRLLCIHLIDTDPVRWREKCICDDLDTGRGQNKFLEYLEEVKISGFTGAREEIDLVRFLFESSKLIKSVTLSVPSEMPCAVSLLKLMGEEDGIDTTDQELLKIPFTDRGCWKLEENVYTWTRYATVSTSM